MALMYNQQTAHNAWLSNLDAAFQQLQSGATNLQKMQEHHAANQSSMFNNLQLRIQSTEGSLQSTLDSLVTLGAAIDEKTLLVSTLGVLNSLDQVIKVVVVIAIILCVGLLNFRAAVLLVAFIGKFVRSPKSI